MSGKLPYMPFYVADWLKEPSLRVCSHEVKGVYIDMLCLMWECEERGVLATAGRAWSDVEIARAVGGDQQQTLSRVVELVDRGVVSRNNSGAVYSRRMVRDQADRAKEAEKKKRQRAKDVPDDVPQDVPPDVSAIESESSFPNGLSRLDQGLELYQLFPRKKARGAALKAIDKALRKVDFETLRMAVVEFAKSQEGEDPKYIPHPASWFNAERWADEPDVKKPKKQELANDHDKKTYRPNARD